MAAKRLVSMGLVAVVGVAPAVAWADGATQTPRASASAERARDTERDAASADPGVMRKTVRLDDRIETALPTGCTYHATVRGTVSPVREGGERTGEVQRLRPDLRVGATVRCPDSTEAHIQERRVRSTGVTREELEHLIAINASVERMQNSGRCMYMPDVVFDNSTVSARRVNYLCPSDRGSSRGGGPN